MLYLVLACAFISSFALFLAVVYHFTRRQRQIDLRLKSYLFLSPPQAKRKQEMPARQAKQEKRPLKSGCMPQVYRRYLEKQLAKASFPLRAGEFFAIQVAGGIMGGILGTALLHHPFFLFPGIMGGFYLPAVYVRKKQHDRIKRFDSQLADALVLISNSLKAGYSFNLAMEAVAREMPSPLADEFKRTLKEMSLGVPTEEALVGMNERIGSKDFDLVVTAILIQLQAGGNLAQLMDNIAHTIRERIRIKRDIRTLTAQGKLSGLVVGSIPFGMVLLFHIINPTYMQPFFAHPIGWLMLIVGLMAQITGFFFIRKIVNVEV